MTEDQSRPGGASEDQLEQWFRQYYPSIFHFFCNRGYSREDSNDFTQETFVAAFRGRRQFRGDASAGTWIFSIAQNLWKNHLRHASQQKRRGRLVSIDQPPSSDQIASPSPQVESSDGSPLERLLEDERMRLLLNAMNALPAQMRRCAYLRYGQHLKYSDIADILGISIDTVKSHLFQANHRLRESLAEFFPELKNAVRRQPS